MLRIWILLACLLPLSGCAHYTINPKLDAFSKGSGYRYINLESEADNSESLFVILTFSGGGTRAAALSYGVLEKLRDTPVQWEGKMRRLLDEVDVISSISGGSFTAAYYGLFRDKTFEEFPERFLYRDIEGGLKGLLFNPANWIKLASPNYGRIDLAADYYDRQIFKGKHFSDLLALGRRPYLMINATDMSVGAQFTFVQESFDLLCSDVAGVPVANAVAASSNFPVAFTPMTLNNYPNGCRYVSPDWVASAHADTALNPSRKYRALLHDSYIGERDTGQGRIKKRPYLHLLDGGVADNIGLRAPMLAVMSNDPQWSVLSKIDRGEIKKLIVITVDARRAPDISDDQRASAPGLLRVLSSVSSVPLDNYSLDSVELLRTEFDYRRQVRDSWEACGTVLLRNQCQSSVMPGIGPANTGLYNIYIGFSRVQDPALQQELYQYPTTFVLDKSQVDTLREVGGELLVSDPDFQRLQREL